MIVEPSLVLVCVRRWLLSSEGVYCSNRSRYGRQIRLQVEAEERGVFDRTKPSGSCLGFFDCGLGYVAVACRLMRGEARQGQREGVGKG